LAKAIKKAVSQANEKQETDIKLGRYKGLDIFADLYFKLGNKRQSIELRTEINGSEILIGESSYTNQLVSSLQLLDERLNIELKSVKRAINKHMNDIESYSPLMELAFTKSKELTEAHSRMTELQSQLVEMANDEIHVDSLKWEDVIDIFEIQYPHNESRNDKDDDEMSLD
jgi:hypothetical protein